MSLLADEVEQERRAEVALAAARGRAHAAGFRQGPGGARAVVQRNDLSGERAEALERRAGRRRAGHAAGRRVRAPQAPPGRAAGGAARWPRRSARSSTWPSLGLSNITLDSYRERLREARLAGDQERLAAPIEKRYREMLRAHDWFGAREAVCGDGALGTGQPAGRGHVRRDRAPGVDPPSPAGGRAGRAARSTRSSRRATWPAPSWRSASSLSIDPENRHRKRLERQLRSAGRA